LLLYKRKGYEMGRKAREKRERKERLNPIKGNGLPPATNKEMPQELLPDDPREAIPRLLQEIGKRRPWWLRLLWFLRLRVTVEEENRWVLWVGKGKAVEAIYQENSYSIPRENGDDKFLAFPEVWVWHSPRFEVRAKTAFIKIKGCPVYFEQRKAGKEVKCLRLPT